MEFVKSDDELCSNYDSSDDQDSGFIASEHVSLTQELIQKQESAIKV